MQEPRHGWGPTFFAAGLALALVIASITMLVEAFQ